MKIGKTEIMGRIDHNKLISLISKYGYKFNFKQTILLEYSFIMDALNLADYENIGECIKFIEKVSTSNPKEIKMSCVCKGKTETFVLKDSRMISDIVLLANTILSEERGETYEKELNIKRKKNLKDISPYNKNFWKQKESIYKEPFTPSELATIINYEKKYNQTKLTGNANIGEKLIIVYDYLVDNGIFGKEKQKEYAFLYDWMVLAGVFPNLEDEGYYNNLAHRKYHKVKESIKAYFDKIGYIPKQK